MSNLKSFVQCQLEDDVCEAIFASTHAEGLMQTQRRASQAAHLHHIFRTIKWQQKGLDYYSLAGNESIKLWKEMQERFDLAADSLSEFWDGQELPLSDVRNETLAVCEWLAEKFNFSYTTERKSEHELKSKSFFDMWTLADAEKFARILMGSGESMTLTGKDGRPYMSSDLYHWTAIEPTEPRAEVKEVIFPIECRDNCPTCGSAL